MQDESIEDILTRAQNFLDITKDILQQSDLIPKVKTRKTNSVESSGNFIQVPRGNFMMGTNDYNDESPQHTVKIRYDFAISKYQVTVKEYLEFAHSTNSNFPEWYVNKNGSPAIEMSHYKNTNLNDDAPIVGISWENAKAYCAWMSEKEGKDYRLPSEAEWEYTCRAGTITRYNFSDSDTNLGKYAWYKENSNHKTHPVGTKRENQWGLYDMHGNVWEWCEDVWMDNYDSAPRDGSANKVGNIKVRVLRGGSWVDSSRYVRSSNRNGFDIDGCDNDIGFRVVISGKLK